MRPPLRDEEGIVLPGNKRVSTRVKPVVMPTIAVWPTASKAPRHLEPAPSSGPNAMPGHVHKATASRRDALEASLRDALGLTQSSVTDKPATAPLPVSDKPVMPARGKPTATAQEGAREPQATQAPASDKPATAPLPANDKPVQAASDKPATAAAPTVPLEAPTDSPRARQWIASIATSLAPDSRRARQWVASIASSLATDSPRARQWIASIATSLVVLAATWWLYRSEIANHVENTIPAATWAGDDELAQVKQALQQERDRTEELARELITNLAQVKQVPQQERDKTEKLATDLVQVKQALQQERDKTEKLESELATDLAQVKQALQQERDKTEKLARELTTDLAQVKQAPQQERDKTEKLATDLVQVKQTLQQELGKNEKLASALAADQVKQAPPQDREKTEKLVMDLAQVKQALQQDRDKAEKLARELTTDFAQVKQALKQERDKSETLARELATDLAQVKQALKQTEMQSGTYGELLVQERTRNRELEAQLAARQDATAGGSRNATSTLSETPGPTQAPATDKPATAPLPASDKPVMPAHDKPATMAARPTAPEASGNSEAARLMARASLLRDQGNIGAARSVLERAAETGSASALFSLAETYDPLSLSAWGTFGTRGDVAKAQELYANALAGGVQEARDRLNALRQ
jgi:hypothetical protein